MPTCLLTLSLPHLESESGWWYGAGRAGSQWGRALQKKSARKSSNRLCLLEEHHATKQLHYLSEIFEFSRQSSDQYIWTRFDGIFVSIKSQFVSTICQFQQTKSALTVWTPEFSLISSVSPERIQILDFVIRSTFSHLFHIFTFCFIFL